MATLCFYKELISAPVIVAGSPVRWEQLDGNRGVLAVNTETEKELADGLSKLAKERRGGVVQITAQQMAEKKTALKFDPSKASAKGQSNMLRPILNSNDPFRRKNAAGVKEIPPQQASAPPVEALKEGSAKAPIVFQPATGKVERKTGKLAAVMQQKLQQP